MYVIICIVIIFLIGIAVWLMLFFNKPRKSAMLERGIAPEEAPFIFSKDKPFVYAPKKAKAKATAAAQPLKEKRAAGKMPAPASVKSEKPEIKRSQLKKEEPPAKPGGKASDSVKESKPDLEHDNSVDFDRLSELIDDFFSSEINPRDTRRK